MLSFIPSCGECPSCQAGLRNLCDLGALLLGGTAVSDDTHRIHTAKGRPSFPMTLLGTFSPYMVVHKSSVVKIDPSIPFEVACLVGLRCHHRLRLGGAQAAMSGPGDDVAIVGIGGVGMGALQGAVNAGARNIFAIDPVEWKRDQALKFGATHAYPDIFVGDGRHRRGHRGPDGAQDHHHRPVSSRARRSTTTSTCTAKGGTCVVTAVANMAESDVKLNLSC